MSKERKAINFFKSYFDVYSKLSDKEKVKFMDALLERQFWGVEPSNLGGMSEFAYISQKHNIDAQVKGYEDKTGEALQPPSAPPSKGASVPPSIQVIGKGKEEGKGKGKEEGEPPAFVFKTSLLNYGFEKNLVEDFLKIRKNKKATNTETALNDFISEIEKTSREKNELFKIIVSKGWAGFKASWNLEGNNNNGGAQHHNTVKDGDYGVL